MEEARQVAHKVDVLNAVDLMDTKGIRKVSDFAVMKDQFGYDNISGLATVVTEVLTEAN